jgi:electron transfer flavoprotein beta subunit
VLALTAGPPEADAVLREALAAGAAQAVRADLPAGAPSSAVASALAAVLFAGARVVVCGVWSLDRGSGSVPAFLAGRLGVAQALGLVTLAAAPGEPAGDPTILAERRLDGGRRERLRVPLPAVISVEGGSARLRRASLEGVRAAGRARITVHDSPRVPMPGVARTLPYRPRARVLTAPASDLSARERVLALTGALTDRDPPQRLVLDPGPAADRILDRLRAWGYIP